MYDYKIERHKIFTEKGQVEFLKTRDHVHEILKKSGAIAMGKAMVAGGDSWIMMAYVDRLMELGEIREIKQGNNVAGQDRIFVIV